ncbi:Uncharacterised protein [Mycobacteroides abscessus subsp. abscessus]|nr:Uncharacterised protein [Mycobacteroides abscessus subsp. abscessus]
MSICPLIPRCTTRAWAPLEPSKVSHRYFPRRPVPLICCPASSPASSTAPPDCLRTARSWYTSVDAMVLPTRWWCSPRRTTSTSGSSGTHRAFCSSPKRLIAAFCSSPKRLTSADAVPCLCGGLLFGLFL